MKISQTSTSSVRRLLSDTVNKRRVVYQKSLRSASSIPPLESSEEDLEQLFKAHTELQNQTWTKTKTKTRPREIKLLSKRNATGKNEFLDYKSPKEIKYPGDVKLSIASKLNIVLPSEHPPQTPWPVFRLLDENGSFRINEYEIDIDKDYKSEDNGENSLKTNLIKKYPYALNEINQNHLLQSSSILLSSYRQMVRLRQMDTILQNAQRQGRISFYMCCRGEEAVHFGSASALTLKDTIFAQYREAGILMWRGFTLQQFTDQCFANSRDLGRGRQVSKGDDYF